jgi:hypothetical protein
LIGCKKKTQPGDSRVPGPARAVSGRRTKQDARPARFLDRVSKLAPALLGFSGGAKNNAPALPVFFSGGAQIKTPTYPVPQAVFKKKSPARTEKRPQRDSNLSYLVGRKLKLHSNIRSCMCRANLTIWLWNSLGTAREKRFIRFRLFISARTLPARPQPSKPKPQKRVFAVYGTTNYAVCQLTPGP